MHCIVIHEMLNKLKLKLECRQWWLHVIAMGQEEVQGEDSDEVLFVCRENTR
jgi:hypothetical protein